MTVTSASTTFDTVISILANSRQTIDDVNKACAAKGLPAAFTFGDGLTDITGNPDYRFEGFGLVVGFPPKLSFWVHYKPESANHVEIGRFTMAMSMGKLSQVQSLLGKV